MRSMRASVPNMEVGRNTHLSPQRAKHKARRVHVKIVPSPPYVNRTPTFNSNISSSVSHAGVRTHGSALVICTTDIGPGGRGLTSLRTAISHSAFVSAGVGPQSCVSRPQSASRHESRASVPVGSSSAVREPAVDADTSASSWDVLRSHCGARGREGRE